MRVDAPGAVDGHLAQQRGRRGVAHVQHGNERVRGAHVDAVAHGSAAFTLSKILEAMARGLPVVSTRLTGIPELVRDGENGALVPPEDASALAEALARLLADGEARL